MKKVYVSLGIMLMLGAVCLMILTQLTGTKRYTPAQYLGD